MEAPQPSAPPPDGQTLIARARSLAPLLAERARDTEQARTLVPEIHAALGEAGLFGILAPPGLGGLGRDIPTHLEVAAELARGCGSSAWVQCLVGYQNMLVGWYPPAAQDEVRAAGGALFTALVMGPTVTAELAEGGIRLTGSWPYVSGVDYANWLLLASRDPDAAPDAPRVLTSLIPKHAVAVTDDWYAMGLRGTGSKTVTLEDVFVPAHRVLCFREVETRGVPGQAVNDGPLFRGFATSTLFAMVVAAPAPGLAECAIEAYRERLHSRWNARMPSSQTEWPSSQMRLGRARARLDATRLSLRENAVSLMAAIEAGEALSAERRVRYRMEVVEVVRVCTEIVYDLFTDAGTGATMDGSVLQRAFRDIHVLRSHFMLTPDQVAENAGRIQLDLPPKPPFV